MLTLVACQGEKEVSETPETQAQESPEEETSVEIEQSLDQEPAEAVKEELEDDSSSKSDVDQETEADSKDETSEEDSTEEDSTEEVADEGVVEDQEVDTGVEAAESETRESDMDSYQSTSVEIGSGQEFDSEKIAKAVEMGFPSPMMTVEEIEYQADEADLIYFELGDLEGTLEHKGFTSLIASYNRRQLSWNDFFGDLDYTDYPRTFQVSLKGNSVYEYDFIDEYQQYYRYYDDNNGLYFEVEDILLGNYSDPIEDLTRSRTGRSCNYNVVGNALAPSHNPLKIRYQEEIIDYHIISHEGEPFLLIESFRNSKYEQRWVDIKSGLLTQAYIFDSDGLLVDERLLTTVENVKLDDAIFVEPSDVTYADITMFIYAMEGKGLPTLHEAIRALIPDNPFGLELKSELGSFRVYSEGLKEGMFGDIKIDDPMYVTTVLDENGDSARIREIKDDRYYTIHDGMEIVEIYDESSREKKFFDFSSVGLLSINLGEEATYAFYDPNNISVSGLYKVYAYTVKDNQFTKVQTYHIESIHNLEPVSDVETYTFTVIDIDESVYDDSCMDTYQIIDQGEGSIYDGEHPPFWKNK